LSKNYLDENIGPSIKVLDNEMRRALLECYDYLKRKRQDMETPVDKEEIFIRLCITLKALTKTKEDYDLLLEQLYKSVLIDRKTSLSKQIEENSSYNDKIIYDSEMNILRKLHRKRKITVSTIFRRNSSYSDILDYIWLRKHGYLLKSRDGRLLVNKSIYSEKLDSVLKREVTLQDLFKYLREVPSMLWPKVVDQNIISNMNINKLLKFADLFYGYNARLDKEIIAELRRRINDTKISSPSTWKKIGQIAEKTRFASTNYLGPYTLRYLKTTRGIKIDKVVKDIQKLPIHERFRVISKIYKNTALENVLNHLDLLTLSCISNPGKIGNSSIRSRALLGKALAAYLDYLLTGNSAYIDYSFMFLNKIDPQALSPKLRPIYESLLRQDKKAIIRMLSISVPEAIEYIGYRVFDLIRTERQINRDILKRAVVLSKKILARIVRGNTRSKLLVETLYRGRPNIRKTLYNFLRYNYKIIRKDWKKTPRIIALIDISGSMLKYSIWAILSLGTVFPLLKHCILFSDKVKVYNLRSVSHSSLMNRFLSHAFLEGFKGYTNIALAVEQALEVSRPGDDIVLFTDLEQTVSYKDPVEAIMRVNSMGRRILVFVPPFHREDIASELVSRGVDVTQVASPEELPKKLGRKLNLKIRDKLIHVRG